MSMLQIAVIGCILFGAIIGALWRLARAQRRKK